MLALELHMDIEVILGWSSEKIDWWMAFFKVRQDRWDADRNSAEADQQLRRGL